MNADNKHPQDWTRLRDQIRADIKEAKRIQIRYAIQNILLLILTILSLTLILKGY